MAAIIAKITDLMRHPAIFFTKVNATTNTITTKMKYKKLFIIMFTVNNHFKL